MVLGESDLKAHITLQLLCSTSSGCCRESLPRPKALKGGQSLSSLAQQSSLPSEQRGDTHHSAANESRMRMVAAAPAPAYTAGCKCTVFYQIIVGFQLTL